MTSINPLCLTNPCLAAPDGMVQCRAPNRHLGHGVEREVNLPTAADWHRMAEEARAFATRMTDRWTRRTMLEIAVRYERLADVATEGHRRRRILASPPRWPDILPTPAKPSSDQ